MKQYTPAIGRLGSVFQMCPKWHKWHPRPLERIRLPGRIQPWPGDLRKRWRRRSWSRVPQTAPCQGLAPSDHRMSSARTCYKRGAEVTWWRKKRVRGHPFYWDVQLRTHWWLKAERIIGSPLLEAAGLAAKYLSMNGARAGILHIQKTATFAAQIGTNTRWPSVKAFQYWFNSWRQAPACGKRWAPL